MTENVDLTQALAAAEARRQAASDAEEQARKSQRDELVGDVLLDIQTVVNDGVLDHDAKVARLRAASDGINGRGTAPAAPVAAAPAPAGSAPFDYAALPEEARQIVDLVAADPGRFTVEEWGAVKDKSYTRLRKDYQVAQAPAGDEDDSSASPEPAAKKTSASAPAKKAASAKKAPATEPKAEQTPAEKPSGWARVKTAAKQAAQNAKQ